MPSLYSAQSKARGANLSLCSTTTSRVCVRSIVEPIVQGPYYTSTKGKSTNQGERHRQYDSIPIESAMRTSAKKTGDKDENSGICVISMRKKDVKACLLGAVSVEASTNRLIRSVPPRFLLRPLSPLTTPMFSSAASIVVVDSESLQQSQA